MSGTERKSSSKLGSHHQGSKAPSTHSVANSSNQSQHQKHAPPSQHSKNHSTNHSQQYQQRPLQSNLGGLPQYLSVLDKCDEVVVREGVEFWSGRENYAVYDAFGRRLFFCRQFHDCCSNSLYNMSIFGFAYDGGEGQEVVQIREPDDWCSLRDYIEVTSPPGYPIGKIVKMIGFFSSNFEIKGPNGMAILKIKSPINTTSFGGDVEFKIFRPEAEEVQIGKIAKKWSGFLKEAFTHRDNFGIVFFKNGKFTTLERTLLLATCIFIDIKYFGDGQRDHNTLFSH